jgi:hypothetical protein
MFWSIDLDDSDGHFCKSGNYPLINTVKNEITDLIEKERKYRYEQSLKNYQKLESSFNKISFSLNVKGEELDRNIDSDSFKDRKMSNLFGVFINKMKANSPYRFTTSPALVSSNQNLYPAMNKIDFITYDQTNENEIKYRNAPITFKCEHDGLIPDRSTGCIVFYQCVWSKSPIELKAKFICPDRTIFNRFKMVCDWEPNVRC